MIRIFFVVNASNVDLLKVENYVRPVETDEKFLISSERQERVNWLLQVFK